MIWEESIRKHSQYPSFSGGDVRTFGLLDPKTRELRHVGMASVGVDVRSLFEHRPVLEGWLASLARKGLEPAVVELGRCSAYDWEPTFQRVLRWARARTRGLLNGPGR